MTELLTIYYNGHFTQMVYPDQLADKLNKYGLPLEDITVVQYPNGAVVAPFNVTADLSLAILQEEQPPSGTVPHTFKSVLKEILATPEGKELAKRIRQNNKKLIEHGMAVVTVEPTSDESQDVAFYSVTAIVPPVNLMVNGVIMADHEELFNKVNPSLWSNK